MSANPISVSSAKRREAEPSRRDLVPAAGTPNAEALGYCRLSLRDGTPWGERALRAGVLRAFGAEIWFAGRVTARKLKIDVTFWGSAGIYIVDG
jgi:hypothetical protein